MTDSKVQVYFDKDYKIRLLDPTRFEKSEQLEKECGSFVEKIGSFNEKIHTLVEVLEAHATRIDAQKLRVCRIARPNAIKIKISQFSFVQAIGLRMAVENEVEHRHRQERALQTMINEKKAELDR